MRKRFFLLLAAAQSSSRKVSASEFRQYLRPVGAGRRKYMSQVSIAARTTNFYANDPMASVLNFDDVLLGKGGEKAGPTRSGIEFCLEKQGSSQPRISRRRFLLSKRVPQNGRSVPCVLKIRNRSGPNCFSHSSSDFWTRATFCGGKAVLSGQSRLTVTS